MGKHTKKTKLTKSEKREKLQQEQMQKIKELQELEQRVQYLYIQNKKIEARIARYQRMKQASVYSAAHLQQMEGDKPAVYKHYGRAFFLSTYDDIQDDLESKIKEAEEQLPQLTNIKLQFDQRLKNESANMMQLQKDFMKLGMRM